MPRRAAARAGVLAFPFPAADRFPKRKMLMLTQSLFLVQATVLGTLTFTHAANVGIVSPVSLSTHPVW